MKRIGGLYAEIGSRPILMQALWRASRGKRDRKEVRAFVAQAQANLKRIGSQIDAGSYRFSAYRAFDVRDTKKRTIHACMFTPAGL